MSSILRSGPVFASKRQKRICITSFVLVAVLWLQGAVLWHDTAHASHNHGSSVMCDLDLLIPDVGSHQSLQLCHSVDLSMLHRVTVRPSGVKASIIPAYLSRAPPSQSFG